MSMIEVKFDPIPPDTQVHEDIAMPLTNPSWGEKTGEGDADINKADISQTLVYGIQCPIICVEGLVVNFEDIISFELLDNDHVPTMSCHIVDNKNIIQQLVPPGLGNTHVTVQILPPHDKYKKIDLHFVMTDYSVGRNNDLYINAQYDLPDFFEKKFKSLGELKLYEFYNKLAKDLKLGFATNTEEKDDKRFMFCKFTSLIDLLNQETENSGEEKVIYNWWIDMWHYLILEDIYERYNTTDDLESDDQYIWICNQMNDVTNGVEYLPYHTKAELSNLFSFKNNQLYIKDYRIINNIGPDVYNGTEKIFSVYSMKDKKYTDNAFADGSANNPTKNFVYKGEVYGDYDYITNSLYSIPFYQKMNKEIVEVDLQSPILGLSRGRQVTLSIYINDDDWDDTRIELEEQGSIKPYTSIHPTGSPLDLVNTDDESQNQHAHFELDKTISTQYLIIGNIFKFSDHKWTHTVQLVRPDNRKIALME